MTILDTNVVSELIAASPSELVVHWISTQRLLDDLKKQHNFTPVVLRVEVEENIGQSATCELRRTSRGV